MNGKFVLLFLLVVCTAFLLPGCVTTGEGQGEEPEKTPIIQQELPEIQEARALILKGSPDSVLQGYELLRNSPAGNSLPGQELQYVAKKLMERFYPRVEYDPGVSDKPSDSIYPALFEDAGKGRFSTLIEDWNSQLTLMAASSAALVTEDEEVLLLCGVAAQAARGLSGPAAVPDPVLPVLILGIIEEKEGDTSRALSYYRQAYGIDDSVYPAKERAARILEVSNRKSEALRLMESVAEDFPRSLEYVLFLSSLYLETGKPESALERLLSVDPDAGHPLFYSYLSLKIDIEIALEQYENASADLELLQQQRPEDLGVLKQYGLLQLELGNTDKGITVLELAREKGLEDEEVNRTLLLFYSGRERWGDARTILEQMGDQLTSLELLSAAVRIYLQTGDIAAAEELAARLVEQKPENPEYMVAYAEILLRRGENGRAGQLLEEALEYSVSRQQRSDLYVMLSEVAETDARKIEVLQSALFENMENLDALVELATLYKRLGEYRKANRYIRQASALAPDDKKVAELAEELGGLVDR